MSGAMPVHRTRHFTRVWDLLLPGTQKAHPAFKHALELVENDSSSPVAPWGLWF